MPNMNKTGLFIFVCFIFSLFSCRTNTTKNDYSEIYKDSVFLNIEGGDLDRLFINNQVKPAIYYRAADRMNRCLSVKGDTLSWDIKSGKEIKISENIFDYITQMWTLSNKKLTSDTIYEIRKVQNTYVVMRKDAPR